MEQGLFFLGVFFGGYLLGYWMRGRGKDETPSGIYFSDRALRGLRESSKQETARKRKGSGTVP